MTPTKDCFNKYKPLIVYKDASENRITVRNHKLGIDILIIDFKHQTVLQGPELGFDADNIYWKNEKPPHIDCSINFNKQIYFKHNTLNRSIDKEKCKLILKNTYLSLYVDDTDEVLNSYLKTKESYKFIRKCENTFGIFEGMFNENLNELKEDIVKRCYSCYTMDEKRDRIELERLIGTSIMAGIELSYSFKTSLFIHKQRYKRVMKQLLKNVRKFEKKVILQNTDEIKQCTPTNFFKNKNLKNTVLNYNNKEKSFNFEKKFLEKK